MHCLRWWLPIFLLPLPAASPFLTVLFVATYAIRTRPCAYCSVIILGLMFSTCAFYSYDPTLTNSRQDDILLSHPASPSTLSKSGDAHVDTGTAASSCWIDLTSGFHSPSLSTTDDVPAGQLGWWSAPTRRRSATVWREKAAKTRSAVSTPRASRAAERIAQWYHRIRSDGLWIGLDKETGFRLHFIAD